MCAHRRAWCGAGAARPGMICASHGAGVPGVPELTEAGSGRRYDAASVASKEPGDLLEERLWELSA